MRLTDLGKFLASRRKFALPRCHRFDLLRLGGVRISEQDCVRTGDGQHINQSLNARIGLGQDLEIRQTVEHADHRE